MSSDEGPSASHLVSMSSDDSVTPPSAHAWSVRHSLYSDLICHCAHASTLGCG